MILFGMLACLVLVFGFAGAEPVGTQDISHLQAGVVKITSKSAEGTRTVGTGFIVKLEEDVLYIVTAAHVAGRDSQPEVEFFTKLNVPVRANVVNIEGDEVTSLAILIVQGKDNIPSGLTTLSIGSSAGLSEGDDILVVGHPREIGDWAVLGGKVAKRKGRNIVVDANIEEGNSGGPMIKDGEVVGLVAGRTRYGLAVTSGSLRDYLEGHRILAQKTALPSVTKLMPTPTVPSKLEKPDISLSGEIIGKDGAPMALIQAGEFWMGSPDDEGKEDEHPRHQVFLDAFYMDKFEVTVWRYDQFVQSTDRSKPKFWDQADTSKHGNLPVVGVDWNDADSYCRWAGKRLPTEAEWEKAARGTDGRTYPWGTEAPTARLANFGNQSSPIVKAYEEQLLPVDRDEAGQSPYGLYHMAGNVWEWVGDWYDKHYYDRSPARNPKGPSYGTMRVFRGGSLYNGAADVRSANRRRFPLSTQLVSLGFRCAQDAK